MWYEQARLDELLDLAANGRDGVPGGYRTYLSWLKKRPEPEDASAHAAWVKSILEDFDRFRILCAVRQGDWGVESVNAAIEVRLMHERLINRESDWYAGRPVMVTRNDHSIGIYNGDVGIALPDATKEGRLRAYFPSGDKITSVLPTRLADIETAFAITVHKVQGSEFSHTMLALPKDSGPIVGRELVYTGIIRASKHFTLFKPNAAVLEAAIKQQTVRASGLCSFKEHYEAA